MIKSGRISEKNFHVLCYATCIFLFAIGHTKIQNLGFITGISVTYGKFVPLLLSACMLLRKTKFNIRTIVVFVLFVLLIVYGFIYNDLSYVMFFIAYYMLACSNCEEKKIYKSYAYVVLSVVFLTTFLALIGLLENDNSWQGRYDLGFTYCTFGPNLFLSACLAMVAWKKDRMRIRDWLLVLLMNQFLYWKTDTDAVYLSVLALFVLWLLVRKKKIYVFIRDNKTISFFFSHMFSILAVLTVILQMYYNNHYLDNHMVLLNKVLSNRLIMGRNVFLRYGPGEVNIIKEVLFGLGVDKVSYLDSSYLALLTSYGLPLLAVFCFLMDYISRKSLKQGELFITLCLFVFAVHCVTDPQLSSFRANPFIIASFLYIRKGKRLESKQIIDRPIKMMLQKVE